MRIHIVQKGDTLWKIAKEYGISFEDLKRLNVHLANPDYIVPGMEIILPERMHKEAPVQPKQHVKESVKKEVPKPTPPAAPAPPAKPAPMPMHEPQMIPIPYPMPMPMPMPMPQQQMWMQPPLEMNWNQNLIMPQMEHPVSPPVHNQTPAPQPQPQPAPQQTPAPVPVPQPPMHSMPPMQHVPHCSSCQQPVMPIMPPMQMVPHCSSCHQPIHHHMMWPMPMPQMPMPQMPSQETHFPMPSCEGKGDDQYQESSSFSSLFNVKHKHQHQEMKPSCDSPNQMMPNYQMDHFQQPCSPCAPWMPPQHYPGGMTPYQW